MRERERERTREGGEEERQRRREREATDESLNLTTITGFETQDADSLHSSALHKKRQCDGMWSEPRPRTADRAGR